MVNASRIGCRYVKLKVIGNPSFVFLKSDSLSLASLSSKNSFRSNNLLLVRKWQIQVIYTIVFYVHESKTILTL
jgi:hypothetical protein